MANTSWSQPMNDILLEKLSDMDKVITPEELEAKGIVALKDTRTGKIEPVRWLKRYPKKSELELKVLVPIYQKEPTSLVSTD